MLRRAMFNGTCLKVSRFGVLPARAEGAFTKTRPTLPPDTIRVTAYSQLEEYLRKFAEGKLGLLLLLGRPGTGKSHMMRAALRSLTPESLPLYVEGHVQPFGLYQKLWQCRDQLVVLDDLDRLYADPNCVRILKPLCSGHQRKTISWITHATRDGQDVPDHFVTQSQVALIANEWHTVNSNVRALEDRAIILCFDPSNEEVHRRAGLWFDDLAVLAFVARWLPHVPVLSLRHYEKGRRLAHAGFADWQDSVLQMLIPDRRVAVMAKLLTDGAVRSEGERVRRFCRETGCSRPTYYRLKAMVQAACPSDQ